MHQKKTLYDHVMDFYFLFKLEKGIYMYCIFCYFIGATVTATYFPHFCQAYQNYKPAAEHEGITAGTIMLLLLAGLTIHYLKRSGKYLGLKRAIVLAACTVAGALIMSQTTPP